MTPDISMIPKETQKTAPGRLEDQQGENARNELGQCYTAIVSSGMQYCPETWDQNHL